MIGASEMGRGHILSFSASPRRQRRRDVAGDGQKGAILLFTGVRYERRDEETLSPPSERLPAADRHLGS